jgi:ribose transport system ATP-binding protein
MSYDTTRVLILDEPTAALSEAEAEDLFEKMEQLKKRGVAMIFISHRLEEIKRVADRVSVMRDGKYIDTLNAKTCDVQDIIRLMIGREVLEAPKT